MRTLIVAEAGVNHNGDLGLAKKLIDVASDCGADFVKFQSFTAENLVTKKASKAKYQVQGSLLEETQFEMLKKLELTKEDHRYLANYANEKKIGFLSTAFDIENAKMLIELGQNMFKIPSGEITNLPFLRFIGALAKKVILSTGMSTLTDVKTALDVLLSSGTPRENISVLHCTSAYPAPYQDVNILAMRTMQRELGVEVGYSDHTLGIEVSIAAVALGATIIEKHFTLDKTLEGPDHGASLEPSELRALISGIRNVESALGTGEKNPASSELENILASRKSIIAKSVIKKGDLFTEFNLTTKRPGNGISPMMWDSIIGKTAQRNYEIDELIEP
jgi:N,N'-diacetyllegionaminate synthase